MHAVTHASNEEIRHLLPKQANTPLYGGTIVFAQRLEGSNGTVLTDKQLEDLSCLFKKREELVERLKSTFAT